jgi:lipopolysaccharide export LptBFGC system permease protein LptF
VDRNVNIITDLNGNKIAVINDIVFKGKRNVDWSDVEQYLRQYVGEFYQIADTKDVVYIGSDLPDEYANSNYTHRLKGASAKAKANAAQGLPEMIEIASGKQFEENRKEKHNKDAQYGWYRYESRFALPVFSEEGEVERYNVFHVLMLMRHAKDEKIYLYDIMEIKKETSNLFQSNDLTQ